MGWKKGLITGALTAPDPTGVTQTAGLGGLAYTNQETANKALDPGDLFGVQSKNKAKATENFINEDRAAYEKLMFGSPKYQGLTNKDGKLLAKYKLGGVGSNLQGLDQRMNQAQGLNVADVGYGNNFYGAQNNLDMLQQRAFGTDTSPWAQKLYDQQALEQAGMSDQLRQNMANQTHGAMNRMAATTGIDAAARERMTGQANVNSMNQMQNLYRQGQMDRLGIGSQDEAQRMALQQQMPGMNLQAAQYQSNVGFGNQAKDMSQGQFNNNLAMQKAGMWGGMADTEAQRNLGVNQFNIQNAIANQMGENQFNQNLWGTKMTGHGANRTADAIARSGNTGGFISKMFG